jgi:hypothetical protein
MQAIQYRYQDNNKYTNRLDTYKYVTRHIYLQLWIFLATNVISYVSFK